MFSKVGNLAFLPMVVNFKIWLILNPRSSDYQANGNANNVGIIVMLKRYRYHNNEKSFCLLGVLLLNIETGEPYSNRDLPLPSHNYDTYTYFNEPKTKDSDPHSYDKLPPTPTTTTPNLLLR